MQVGERRRRKGEEKAGRGEGRERRRKGVEEKGEEERVDDD